MRKWAIADWLIALIPISIVFTILAGINGDIWWIVLCSLSWLSSIIIAIVLIARRFDATSQAEGNGKPARSTDNAIIDECIAGIGYNLLKFCEDVQSGHIDYSTINMAEDCYGVASQCISSATIEQKRGLAELQNTYAQIITSDPVYTPAFGLHFHPNELFLFDDIVSLPHNKQDIKDRMDRALHCFKRHRTSSELQDLEEANSLLSSVQKELDPSDVLMLARWYALVHINSDELQRAFKKAVLEEDDE